MPEKTDRVCVFATIRPKREHFAKAVAALEEIIPPTLEEPGCHVFAAYESREEPGVLHLFEVFEDDDAITFHYAQDYTKAVFAQYKEWLAAPVQITHMTATSAVSADQFA